MLGKSIVAVLFVLCGNFAWADAVPIATPSRGELLYATHCIACHSTEMHWRDRKLATDRETLRSEVLRWQAMSGLGWDDGDIAEVVAYLNALHYHYAAPD